MSLQVLLLAVGLAMDATAVAAVRASVGAPRRELLLLALSFAAFQGAMPALGAVVGLAAEGLVKGAAPWLTLAVLVALGLKMLRDAREGGAPDAEPLSAKAVLGLAVVTSLDALVAGVTLPLSGVPVAGASAAIAAVTFGSVGLGIVLGRWAGAKVGPQAQVVGGALLVLLGLRAGLSALV